jgi:HAD superfamily PSPase-like hydrolase
VTGLPRMVVFDMDGVLADIESSWQTVHRAFKVNNEANFQKHLRNEMDYREFMRSDIGLWGKPHITRIKAVLDQARLMKGAKETIMALRTTGIKTAIISSGIMTLAERIKEELGIDHVFANKLLTDEAGYLVGEGEEAVNLQNKGVVLEELCRVEGLQLADCAVVGDSRFDVPLFEKAGLSIAFNAQDRWVREAADVVIDDRDLRKILPVIFNGRSARARLSFRYAKEETAAIIVGAISPDNYQVPPGLTITASRRGAEVHIRVFCVKGSGTLLATLDDLLSNIQVAEKTVRALDAVTGR